MSSIAIARGSTLLLFGDQTDAFYPTIRQLYLQSATNARLRSFLKDSTTIVRKITNCFEPAMRSSLGGPFTDLLQLAERFRTKEDLDGVAHAILITVMRTAVLLQYVEEDQSLLTGPVYLAGACGGLLNAAAMAVAIDVDSLYQASLTIVELICRLTEFLIHRSREVEDVKDSWGWSVVGVQARDLQNHLDQFHKTESVPPHRQAKIGASGLHEGWHTVVGPPSVLRQFFERSPAGKALRKQKLRISTLVHVMSNVSDEEIDGVLGSFPLLESPVQPHFTVISLGSTAPYSEPTWGRLMRAVMRDICSQPLNMANGLPALDAALGPTESVKLKVVAPTLHLTAVSSSLEETERKVTVISEPKNSHDQISPNRIAIVGMSGRYPASNDLEQFWELICQGCTLHSEIPQDRFDINTFYDRSAAAHCSTSTKYGCFIKDPGLFDTRFFNMSPREALYLDPAQRLFLMSTYEALETAGYSRSTINSGDSSRVGTFVGQAAEEWRDVGHAREYDAYSLNGVQRGFASGRVNHHFKWDGPAVSLDTACSSGLTAVYLASLALRSGECDVAVAGGTNVLSSPVNFHLLSKAGFLSTTGGCKTYRDDADGYCRGDFVGSFVLKRLEDALTDNDNVLSIIAGSARNHSTHSTSITQSDHHAQELLMGQVLRNARMEPADVSYVEMHGTGTQVGDVAEMTAVTNVFGGSNSKRQALLKIGTIKSNIGHGEGAAGAAALIKAIQMFQTGVIPPQAGLPSRLNPRFPNLAELNIEIPDKRLALQPQTILINSFDASGGNTCLLLEAPRPRERASHEPRDPRSCHVVVLSAKTAKSHEANKRRLLQHLRAFPDIPLEDLAYTTTARRLHHPLRSAYAMASMEELVHKLEAELQQTPPARKPAPVVFTFTGQGSLYAGMGAELYRTSAVFRNKLDGCVRLCQARNFPPFLDLIVDDAADVATRAPAQTQLAMVSLQVALAAFWASCRVVPDAVVGHSLGEYAALHVAGVLSLADMLFLVGRRAELIRERCKAGTHAMLAVSASKEEVEGSIGSQQSQVACINGPRTTVISGKTADIDALKSVVECNGARCTVLPIPYAFHSSQLDSVLAELAACAKGVAYKQPRIPVASTLTGEVVAGPGVFNGAYTVRQTREQVNFVGAVSSIDAQFKDCMWL